jgi:hypothetical protein
MKTTRIFFIMSCSFRHTMGNISDETCREIRKTRFMLYNFFPHENRAVCEICRKTLYPGGPEMTIWRMHIACWTPKATNTHSQYVINFFFSTATVVVRRRLGVTLHVQYIVCLAISYSTAAGQNS